MHITRRIWIQIAIFIVVSLIAFTVMALGYMRLPNLLFGMGHYQVTIQLREAAGLYPRANVTYRGTEVGQVKDVRLIDSGVAAVLSLRSDVKIPSDLEAQVHSQSAIGEQYVALLPRNSNAPPLRNGDVISATNTSIPPDINALLDATNRGLAAIPQDNLNTAINESYNAFGGLGPDLARFIKGSTALAIDARRNLNELTNVIDNTPALLNTQTDTSGSIQAWAKHLADITEQLKSTDPALRGVLDRAGPAADELRQLFERLHPTLPLLLANLVSLGQVAVTYQPNIEQILVLLPQGAATIQAIGLANRNTKQSYQGAYLSFNLNLNLPPTCSTGFLPAPQRRVPTDVDYPDRPDDDLYCRVPQDSPLNVRGVRNTPCETVPGKRAPTVKMCESNENYVPLNDGFNWKGDPNATLSGQPVPQPPPGQRHSANAPGPPSAGLHDSADAPPSPGQRPSAGAPLSLIGTASYDPATGTYVGPDGSVYTQADLANRNPPERTWQTMLLPPAR